MRTIPQAIYDVIHDATQGGCDALAGATITRQGEDYAVLAPAGLVYIISIRPAKLVVAANEPTKGAGEG